MSDTRIKSKATPQRSFTITTAAILFLVFGLGTLVANVPTIIFMVQNRTFPVVFGIPLLANSYADTLGMDFMIVATILFEIVNALEVLAGYWLWKSDKRGGKLGLILLPFGLVFWLLFALPIFLIVGPLRAITMIIGWKTLRQ